MIVLASDTQDKKNCFTAFKHNRFLFKNKSLDPSQFTKLFLKHSNNVKCKN